MTGDLTPEEAHIISSLAAEIVSRMGGEAVEFKHIGNNKPGMIQSVPRAKSRKSFQITEKKTGWLKRLLKHAGSVSSESDVAEWMMESLSKYFEEPFIKVANKMGLFGAKVMGAVEATAMWTEAGLTTRQQRTILKHLRQNFGYMIQVPPKDMSELLRQRNDNIQLNFFEMEYFDKGDTKKEKKGEKVQGWTANGCQIICDEIKEVIEAGGPNDPISFGYLLEEFIRGCTIVLGSDHGAEHSQLLAKINLLSSTVRRVTGKIEMGSRTIQFGNIRCRTDKSGILINVAQCVNDFIRDLKESMMVGIKDDANNIDVIYVPKKAKHTFRTDVDDEGRCFFLYDLNDEVKAVALKSLDGQELEIWTIIENFDYYVTADLALMFTVQGRTGHSSSRCAWCDVKSADLKKGKKGKDLTLDQLKECEGKINSYNTSKAQAEAQGKDFKQRKPETNGVVEEVQWNVDPGRLIVPLLHLLIGLVNKTLSTFRDFLDKFVELIGEEEQLLRTQLIEANERFEMVKDRTEELRFLKSVAYGKLMSLGDGVASLPKGDPRAVQLLEAHTALRAHIAVLTEEYEALEKEKPVLRAKIKKLTAAVNEAKKKRIGDRDGLDTIINRIMREIAGIIPQAFHGGSLNGVDCRRFLDNVEEIFELIKDEAMSRIRDDRYKKQGGKMTESELEDTMSQYEKILDVMDVCFSKLRTPAPTEDEKNEADEAVFVLKKLWINAGINITPKAHVLFEHAIKQFRRIPGGIADKAEDFVEKFHQTAKGLAHITGRMPKQCYKQQQMIQVKRQLARNNPHVQRHRKLVQEKSRRNFKKPRLNAEIVKKQLKTAKRQQVAKKSYFKEIAQEMKDIIST
jgi:hypothetical protein